MISIWIVAAVLIALILLDDWRRQRDTLRIVLFINEKEVTMATQLPVGQKLTVRAAIVDKQQKPIVGGVTGIIAWDGVPAGLATLLFPAADGSLCEVAASSVGTFTLTAKVKNLKGREIIGSMVIDCTAPIPEADSILLTADTPVDQ